jgi:hypothetical protein
MKTVYHTNDVWFPNFSIKIEPKPGTGLAGVYVRYAENPSLDDKYSAYIGADNFLAGTPIPAVYRRETAKVIESLVFDYGLVGLVIYPTREGWGVGITIRPNLETQYLSGEGKTPADAIRNSNFPSPLRSL